MNETALAPDELDLRAVSSNGVPRCCVGCGYNLTGLDDAPRCPECGLLNIPSAYREQVWSIVDARRWFFSNPVRPWARRPPGWWWALDRPGDVRRALRFAVAHLTVSMLIVLGAVWLADGFAVRVVETAKQYDRFVFDPAVGSMVDLFQVPSLAVHSAIRAQYESTFVVRLGMRMMQETTMEIERSETPCYFQWGQSTSRVFEPVSFWMFVQKPDFRHGVLVFSCLWIVLTLACPLFVGLYTQLRPGLPAFARPPRTILAAGLYEFHRATYLAVACALALVPEVMIRLTVPWNRWVRAPNMMLLYSSMLLLVILLVLIYGVAGWIGPLRSDYTHQLVRSRVHLLRILGMYAGAIPILCAFTVVAAGATFLTSAF